MKNTTWSFFENTKWSFYGNTEPKSALITAWTLVFLVIPVTFFTRLTDHQQNYLYAYTVLSGLTIIALSFKLKSRLVKTFGFLVLFLIPIVIVLAGVNS
ncbi:hypothetical protein CCASP_00835 [Corynebacterium caspium DSM 44850]|nr:hypothetical protein CCASP_00835 [Corynebacterium caspium DSM 44850]